MHPSSNSNARPGLPLNAEGFYQHPEALVETRNVGARTRIWAFSHILPGAIIGADCNICDHVFVEDDVRIGDRVTVKCGVQLWNGLTLEDEVFIGPNATFTNDRFPQSRKWLAEPMRTIVRRGASIGANATILPGLTIGENAMVGAGAVVTHSVPPNAIVTGNPASICGYADARPVAGSPAVSGETAATAERVFRVRGVRAYPLPRFTDLRGSLVAAELGKGLPFEFKRFFVVFGVPSREVRGEHAHRTLHQFLVCLRGDCSLMVDDGTHREEILLNTPRLGVYLPPMVWAVQYRFSADAMLLVLASDLYESEDYIRDYSEYAKAVQATGASNGSFAT